VVGAAVVLPGVGAGVVVLPGDGVADVVVVVVAVVVVAAAPGGGGGGGGGSGAKTIGGLEVLVVVDVAFVEFVALPDGGAAAAVVVVVVAGGASGHFLSGINSWKYRVTENVLFSLLSG